jgi:8-oxo-dGTP diphosphatase
MLFLVRHAKAGERRHDAGDDKPRPLTGNGWEQATGLVQPLVAAGASGPLLSSPYVRCMQTLQPLADKLGCVVQSDKRLSEGKRTAPVIDMLSELPDGAVLCSHGDMIPDVMAALQRRGCTFTNEPNWKKASVWALTRGDDGQIVNAESWPPPA